MNCKQGDMAIVIANKHTVRRRTAGMIGKCVEFVPAGGRLDGEFFSFARSAGWWLDTGWFFADDFLRPVSGLPDPESVSTERELGSPVTSL